MNSYLLPWAARPFLKGSTLEGKKLLLQELCFALLFSYQKADDKIFVCKFSKNAKSKLYHIETSRTRGKTV